MLGQTLRWTPADAAAKVVDGDLVEAPEAFEVADGLLGSRFKYSRFSHALPAAAADADAKAEPVLFTARSDALLKQQQQGKAAPSGVSASRRLLHVAGGIRGRALLEALLPDEIAGGPTASSEVAARRQRRLRL